MKGLSLWQPWASAIAIGAKRIETRGWSFAHGSIGPVAIHAAKTAVALHTELRERRDLWRRVFGHAVTAAWFPLGAVVATAEIFRPTRTEELVRHWRRFPKPGDELESQLGNYSPGRWAWPVTNVVQLAKPVLCRGRQGLFVLPADVAAAVEHARSAAICAGPGADYQGARGGSRD